MSTNYKAGGTASVYRATDRNVTNKEVRDREQRQPQPQQELKDNGN